MLNYLVTELSNRLISLMLQRDILQLD